MAAKPVATKRCAAAGAAYATTYDLVRLARAKEPSATLRHLVARYRSSNESPTLGAAVDAFADILIERGEAPAFATDWIRKGEPA